MNPSDGRTRACQGCQEQKVRCDIQQAQNSRCSRCHRMGLECLKAAPRRRNRQTKAALQRELDLLKQKFQDTPEAAQVETPGQARLLPQALPSPFGNTCSTPSGSGGADGNVMCSPDSARLSPTLSRVLDGREYNAWRIDECFTLFSRDYHPILPVLDTELAPNKCYEQSPFLFWTVLVTGCRRYTEDPTMLEFLGPRINQLAFSSLSSRASPICTIKGLLILCAWPAPLKSMTKDMTYVASGAAIHLALQLGLHVPGVGQDFSPTKLCPDALEVMLRHRLWSLACIVCQVTGYSQGLPPTMTHNFLYLGSTADLIVSDEVQFHVELNHIQATSMSSLMQQALSTDPFPVDNCWSPQSEALNMLVKSCDNDLHRLAPRVVGEMRALYFNCSRLHIGSFYFFSTPPDGGKDLEHSGLIELHSTACKVINDTKAIFRHEGTWAACPAYVHRTMILAAFIVLKISRSCLAHRLDLNIGEKAYFTAIVALRESSLENDDLYARGAMILAQLWTSTRVFRRPDGAVDSLTLRIRSRLSMGVVFDCFWWWREEFQGKYSPYNHPESQRLPTKEDSAVPQHFPDSFTSDMAIPGPQQESFATMSGPFPDYDWAQSIDFSAPANLAF